MKMLTFYILKDFQFNFVNWGGGGQHMYSNFYWLKRELFWHDHCICIETFFFKGTQMFTTRKAGISLVFFSIIIYLAIRNNNLNRHLINGFEHRIRCFSNRTRWEDRLYIYKESVVTIFIFQSSHMYCT